MHGLIKTLFPESSADPGVLVPLTAESQVLLSLPVPADSIHRGKVRPSTGIDEYSFSRTESADKIWGANTDF